MAGAVQPAEGQPWDPAGPGDPLDCTEGALSSLAVVHVLLCWTLLLG